MSALPPLMSVHRVAIDRAVVDIGNVDIALATIVDRGFGFPKDALDLGLERPAQRHPPHSEVAAERPERVAPACGTVLLDEKVPDPRWAVAREERPLDKLRPFRRHRDARDRKRDARPDKV